MFSKCFVVSGFLVLGFSIETHLFIYLLRGFGFYKGQGIKPYQCPFKIQCPLDFKIRSSTYFLQYYILKKDKCQGLDMWIKNSY